MSRNQKVMAFYTQWRSALWTSIKELFLLLKFDNSSSSVIRDKEICQVIMSKWHYYRLRQSNQWNPFNDVYLAPKFDVSSFFVTGDIYRISN